MKIRQLNESECTIRESGDYRARGIGTEVGT